VADLYIIPADAEGVARMYHHEARLTKQLMGLCPPAIGLPPEWAWHLRVDSTGHVEAWQLMHPDGLDVGEVRLAACGGQLRYDAWWPSGQTHGWGDDVDDAASQLVQASGLSG